MIWVDGEGPAEAVGFVVGEAPGSEETKVGRPFVGPAGKLFEAALISLQLERGDIYITNVVKSFPENSRGRARTPTPEEVRSWAPDLLDEIQRYCGVPMLALGKCAAVTLTDRWRPGQCARGSVWVAWHPAYVLRRRSLWHQWLAQLEPWSRAVVRLSTKRKEGLVI